MKETDEIKQHIRILGDVAAALKKLNIVTVGDLLRHFPVRYGDTSQEQTIASLNAGEQAVVYGTLTDLAISKGFRTKINMASGKVADETGKIQCVWFNQPYIAKMIQEGALVRIEGKISKRKKDDALYFSNPKVEVVTKVPLGVGDSLFGSEGEAHTLYPVYPESRGISSNWIYHAVSKVFKSGLLETLIDPIPKDILEKYNLPSLQTALIWIHTPRKNADALSARKRFSFEEIFLIQLQKQKSRKEYERDPAYVIEPTSKSVEDFMNDFPFKATEAQTTAINTILKDFKKGHAMARLLEGDVGSGKTAVAATTAYAAVTTIPKGQNYGRLQVAYMCPTEILASQHFDSFIQYFSKHKVQVALMTGSGCKKFPSKADPTKATPISRTQLLKWVANGEIPIVIGTHALIQKSVIFKNLAYVIIDEQHRFGTNQRGKLVRKEATKKVETKTQKILTSAKVKSPSIEKTHAPHLLSMTATPIPRTLALTMYGDLDLTLLDQMPHGRKPIITEIVLPNDRKAVYEKVRAELQTGRQAYVICPRIYEPDPNQEASINAKSVTEEAARLKKDVFQEYSIGILHSKMTPAQKDATMLSFKNKQIDILCATSVVEVGVNVPNATVIIIEGGERFGLSQLHQLRGRVIRSNNQAYCYVFAESKTEKTVERLKALKTAKNGFELAEYDLQFRGSGGLSAGKQWGVSDIAMEALQNLKMVEAARNEAKEIIETDDTLSQFPTIKAELEKRKTDELHFE